MRINTNKPLIGHDAVKVVAQCLAGLTIIGVAGCSQPKPGGQVLATVNGLEITAQDVQAEARAEGNQAPADPKVILQKVIARVLLYQEAHNQGLDKYPGFPSDVTRLRQAFLAEKMAQSVVKPGPAPTPQQVQSVMAARPYMFKQRERIVLDELAVPPAVDAKSLQGLGSMDALTGRLRELGVPGKAEEKTIDTAQLDSNLAAKLDSESGGALFFLQATRGATIAMAIKSITPVNTPDDQQVALATRLVTQGEAEQQLGAEVNKLKTAAKISYQASYAPTAPKATAEGVH